MQWYKVLTFSFLAATMLQAIDNLHFYRANFWWGEPRFEREWLTTLDVSIGGGDTVQGRNGSGRITSLFGIYGPQNLQHLARGVPDLDPNNPLDRLLITVDQLPENPPFGFVKLCGALSLHELVIDFRQNFRHGFFVQAHLPVRTFQLQHVTLADLSPNSGSGPTSQSYEWHQLLINLDAILALHGLSAMGYKKRGPGDLTLLAGWTCNYQKNKYLDFIDATFKIGLLMPTDSSINSNIVFDLSTGYNQHTGIYLSGDSSIGIWEWLTLGVNSGALFLFKKPELVRVRTSPLQQGFIKLAATQADVQPGIYWHAGAYIKADHFNEVFSLTVGYSFNQKTQDHLTLAPPFDSALVNSDPVYQPWSMHTIHVFTELDLARESHRWYPRISFFYNNPVAGKRIANLAMGGADFGIDITWQLP